eukprot:14229317-Alexandrium_andersonii.AAC.1
MSASLVGSEMCIRDSLVAPLGALPRCRKARRMFREQSPPRTADCMGERPVSYTHLTLPTICSV